ncbi:ribosomal large subunit pseudouridine synthase f, partial [Nannochloropsis gaditana]
PASLHASPSLPHSLPPSLLPSQVRVDRPLTPEDLTALRDGIVISTPVQRDRADRILTAKTLPCEVQLLAPWGEGRNGDVGGTPGFGSNSNLNSNFFRHSRYGHNARSNQRACFEISLREGRNRQIRRMCEARGLRVLELHRASVMNIDLQGLRGEGWWAHLNPEEEAQVRRAVAQWEEREGRGGGGEEGWREEGEGEEEE